MNSRFFQGSDSDSDSDSSSGNDAPVVTKPTSGRGVHQVHVHLSDSEEETKRVVKTPKDKRTDEMLEMIKQMKNCKKIKDMAKILGIFEDLAKTYERSKQVFREMGLPRFYLKMLIELENWIVQCWDDRELRKGLSKNSARALTTLRQKLKKYVRDNGYDAAVTEYRENPGSDVASDVDEAVPAAKAESDSDSDSDSDDDMAGFLRKDKPKAEPKSEPKKQLDDDSDLEDESDWDNMSASDSSDSEIDIEGTNMEDLRKYFLKKAPADKGEKTAETRQKRKDQDVARKLRGQQRKELRGDEPSEEGWVKVTGAGTAERPKLFKKDDEISHDSVVAKMMEVLAVRGKKGTDRRELVDLLVELMEIGDRHNLGPALHIKMLFAIIAGYFDYNSKINDCMEFDIWKSTKERVHELTDCLIRDPQIYCSTQIDDEHENIKDPTQQYRVKGSLLVMLERLDDEYMKVLQNADPHSTEYVDKLKGEGDLYQQIEDMQHCLEVQNAPPEFICRVYMRLLEHLYYKFDTKSLDDPDATPDLPSLVVGTHGEPAKVVIERLCHYIYAHDDTRRLKSRAILCQIYHHALHDRWHAARDLMLMSHLQGSIEHSDVSTQILYNRTVCQLGLCAFRHGFIKDAHTVLSEIQNCGKQRELLAQGLSNKSQNERTVEQEKMERQRQVPYHMHINLELLETTYLIAAMLLEIPLMASKEFNVKHRLFSRSFHYQLKLSERQSLLGPPENTREHVVAAARALLDGNWRACSEFVINDKMNAKVWNLFHRCDGVKTMLIRRVKEESLRTYMLTYATVYETVSLNSLSEMFDLTPKQVHGIISKMIIQEELTASMDEPNECVVMHRVEPTKMQALSVQLAEKLGHLADNNEQIIDPRSGQSYNYRQNFSTNWFQQRQQQGNQQQPRY